jgi:hypothetical protein
MKEKGNSMHQVLLAVQKRLTFVIGLNTLLFILIGMMGCSQGGGGPAVFKAEGSYKTGYFIDSPVEGLQYHTITWDSTTDSKGTFLYQDGEEITFSIGGVVLGRTQAKSIITPVDLDNLVQPNFSTRVINITRFLLSLDQDGNPGNGITIPQGIRDALKYIHVDFSNPVLDNDAGVKNMFEILNGKGIFPEELDRGLVSSAAAQIHLENTVNQIAAEDEQAAEALKNLKIQASINLLFESIIMVEGQSLNLQGSVYGGKAPYTYSWQINDEKPFSTKQSPGNFTFKTQGSYTLTFTSSDSTLDKKTDVRHITVLGPETQEGPFDSDSIPTASIISPPERTTITAGSTVDFQAIINNGNVPLYYGWSVGVTPGNSYNPQNEVVVYLSPRTYMITQGITLNSPGTYSITLAVKDTAQGGKTRDDHAASVLITVK